MTSWQNWLVVVQACFRSQVRNEDREQQHHEQDQRRITGSSRRKMVHPHGMQVPHLEFPPDTFHTAQERMKHVPQHVATVKGHHGRRKWITTLHNLELHQWAIWNAK